MSCGLAFFEAMVTFKMLIQDADKVWLKIKGDRKYLFAMMDNDTRFWIAQKVTDSKFKHDAQSLLKMENK